jgi:hypothetical protein
MFAHYIIASWQDNDTFQVHHQVIGIYKQEILQKLFGLFIFEKTDFNVKWWMEFQNIHIFWNSKEILEFSNMGPF